MSYDFDRNHNILLMENGKQNYTVVVMMNKKNHN